MTQRPDHEPRDAEGRALRLGLWLSILFAAAPTLVAMLSDSQVMLLEAKYGVVDAILAYLTLVAHRKIQQPPDSEYHYGYAKYEPMVNAVEGLLVLAVCLSTIVTGVQDIVHPDDIDNDWAVIGYTALSAMVCLAMAWHMRRLGRCCHSELVKADSQVWFVDGMISLGACAAFTSIFVLGRTSLKWVTPYLDPSLAVVVALSMLPYAKELLQDNMRDLLDANPGGDIQERIQAAAEACRARHDLPGSCQVLLRKAGRRIFVAVHMRDDPAKTREQLRGARRCLHEDLSGQFHDVDLHLYFDRTAPEAVAGSQSPS